MHGDAGNVRDCMVSGIPFCGSGTLGAGGGVFTPRKCLRIHAPLAAGEVVGAPTMELDSLCAVIVRILP